MFGTNNVMRIALRLLFLTGTVWAVPAVASAQVTSPDSKVAVQGPIAPAPMGPPGPADATGPVTGRVHGESTGIGQTGVYGGSTVSFGVFGRSLSVAHPSVYGEVGASEPSGATGVIGACYATTGFCNGVNGYTRAPGDAVLGHLDASTGTAVRGFASATSGVANGVVGVASSPQAGGVIGVNDAGGHGVRGSTTHASGAGVYGVNSAGGNAGVFEGHVLVAGNLVVNGTVSKPGGGSWSVASDSRLKKTIEPISGSLSTFLRLRGVTYEYTDPAAINELPGIHLGMVAQEVEQVFPSWVDTAEDGHKRLTFRGFEALTVEAVRELSRTTQQQISELRRENAELRQQLEALTQMMRELKNE